MEKIDASYKAFEKILSEINNYSDTIFSEEDTRVKIVDRIFTEALFYPFADFTTEPKAGKGFIDYKFNINGTGKLIIEAKRDGIKFNIDEKYSGRAFNLNGPVFKDTAIVEGVDQAIYYAGHQSIELACLTNGHTWIIFRACRFGDGKAVLDGKAFVFSTLDAIKSNFKLFYELLSPEAIDDMRYRALFQEAEGSQIRVKEFSKTLQDPNNLKLMSRGEHAHDFDRVMSEFFSKLTGDADPDFLNECFVETKESRYAEHELHRISEELLSNIKTLETREASDLQEVIARVKNTNRHEFVLRVGGKGAGKTTFIDRFFKNVLSTSLQEETILIRINLALSKGGVTNVIDWLDISLLEETEKVLFNGKPTYDQILGVFYHEYDRLRTGPWKPLYDKDKEAFKIDFGKHVEKRREDRPTEHIKRLIGDITKSRKKIPVLVFDNADHFGIDFQEKVFQYARAIYEKEICLVIIPITDKTSWQLSKQGAIQSFENETLFLPYKS